MCFCTIISMNYLARAKTLCSSLLCFYPGFRLHVLITDLSEPSNLSDDFASAHFKVYTCSMLNLQGTEAYKAKYKPVEFDTFVKPAFLSLLLSENEEIIYTDPDTFYFSEPDEVFRLLKTNNIILTPHRFSDEKENLNSLFLLRYGYYNLGFIALHQAEETTRFLSWWQWKLEKYCLLDLNAGLAWDQRWCDLVPVYFEGVHLLRNRGYNVAFWNLFERNIVKDPEGAYWIMGKEKLVFYHFSHYLPEFPEYIRSVPNENSFTPFPKDQPCLPEIFAIYRSILMDSEETDSVSR